MAGEKKKFFDVEIPFIEKKVELFAFEQSALDKKTIKLDLTNLLKGRALEISLYVELKNNKLIAIPKKAELINSYVRRLSRGGTDYAEDSFLAECKDNRIRVKPLIIARNRVSNRVLKGLREKAKEEIIHYAKSKTFEEIMLGVINNKLQKELMPKLKKIYPVAVYEIKFIGIENPKGYEKYEQEKEIEQSAKKEKEE